MREELELIIENTTTPWNLIVHNGKIRAASYLWGCYTYYSNLAGQVQQLNCRLNELIEALSSAQNDSQDQQFLILHEKLTIALPLTSSWINLLQKAATIPEPSLKTEDAQEAESAIQPLFDEQEQRYRNYPGEAVFATLAEKIYRAFIPGAFDRPSDFSSEHLNQFFVKARAQGFDHRVLGTECKVTYLGHSTVLVQVVGLNILFDPLGDADWIRPCFKRYTKTIKMSELPRIDIVVISHNHADHAEPHTLTMLAKIHNPAVIIGKGSSEWLKQFGFDAKKIHEVKWWDSLSIEHNDQLIEIACVPAQHGSQTSLSDSNKMLWCGFVVAVNKKQHIYFAGDTANTKLRNRNDESCDLFQQIAYKYPSIDLAMIPIGPVNEPERHICGKDVLTALNTLGKNTKLLPIHHGVLRPGPDKIELPIQLLMQAIKEQQFDGSRILPFKIGVTFDIAQLAQPTEESDLISDTLWKSFQ